MKPKIIIHGGFFSESSTSNEVKIAKQKALERISRASYVYLESHSALETVIYAVSLLENDELFNAGVGSQIQSDGKIRMSASVMDGSTKRFSGVINLEDVENPVQVAAALFEHDDRVLGGDGAQIFARNNGFEYFDPRIPQRIAEYEAKKNGIGVGTVGCVALDKEGKLAASTSTGGKGFEMVGRISDSATVAGNYCNEECGISCTGVGEDIVSGAVAAKIVTRVSDGFSIKEAFEKTFSELKPFDGFCGSIGIDKHGNIFYQDSHPSMVFCSFDGEKIKVFE